MKEEHKEKHRYKVTLEFIVSKYVSYPVAKSKLQARTHALQRLASILKIDLKELRTYFICYNPDKITIRRLRDE